MVETSTSDYLEGIDLGLPFTKTTVSSDSTEATAECLLSRNQRSRNLSKQGNKRAGTNANK